MDGIEPGLDFDGADALKPLPPDRRLFFSGWMQEGPSRTPSYTSWLVVRGGWALW
jgi:hypothetical protein